MAAQPLLTVGVTTYRLGEKVRPTLDALAGQTAYRQGQADLFEVIVVDDASPDDTFDIASEVAATRPNWTVHRLPENSGGASRPRNWVLDHAAGEHIMFCDGDDRLGPEAIERILSVLTNYDPDFVSPCVWSDSRWGVPPFAVKPNLYDATLLDPGVGYLSAPGRVIRRSVIGSIRFREDLRIGEDRVFYAAIRVGCRDQLRRIIALNDYPYYEWAASPPGLGLVATTPSVAESARHVPVLIELLGQELAAAPDERFLTKYVHYYLSRFLARPVVWTGRPDSTRFRDYYDILSPAIRQCGGVFDPALITRPHAENLMRACQAGLTYDQYLAALGRVANPDSDVLASFTFEERATDLALLVDVSAKGCEPLQLNAIPYLGTKYTITTADIGEPRLRLEGTVQSAYLPALCPEVSVHLALRTRDGGDQRLVIAPTAETGDQTGTFRFDVGLQTLPISYATWFIIDLQLSRGAREITHQRLHADDFVFPPTMFVDPPGHLDGWHHVDHAAEGPLEFAWYLTKDGHLDLHLRKPV